MQALKIPFREAHHITGRIVALAATRGVALERLTLDEMQGVEPRITKQTLRRAGRRPLGQEPNLLRRNRAGERAPPGARLAEAARGGVSRLTRGRATVRRNGDNRRSRALTAAKIRDMPISAALRRVLLTAAHEAGVDVVRITSGGQPGSRGQRIGSNRHDGGNAADLELVAQGRTLDFTHAADLDTICRFVASAAACGATGIGAGVNYMGPRRLHVGFGNGPHDTTQVVWGEGGAAANAPDWLRDAAQLGWSYAAGAPVPEGAAPQPPRKARRPAWVPPEGAGGFADELDGLLGALLAPSARADRLFAWMARGAVAVVQLCRRLPVTGLPDAETWAILIRFAAPVPRRGVADRRAWRRRPREERRRFRSGRGSRGARQVSRDARRFRRPWAQCRVRLPSPGCGGGKACRRGLCQRPALERDPAQARRPHSRPRGIARRALGLGLCLHRFGAKILKPGA